MKNSAPIADEIVRDAQAGRLPKQAMADLLAPEPRRAFLAECAAIEKQYTEACTAAIDPCLESGCSLEGEVCLQPLLRSETEYQAACGAAWMKFVRGSDQQ
jgi:hypothetical protein